MPDLPDPVAVLAAFNKHAYALTKESEALLHDISLAQPVTPEPGNFYAAFDGSIMFVCRRHTKCKCPRCSGVAFGGVHLSFGPDGVQIHPAAVPEAETNHEEEPNAPEQFVAVLLRGGHDIKNVGGNELGDRFLLDNRGFVLLPAIDEEMPQINKVHVTLLGMSLKEKLTVKLSKVSARSSTESA